jgi:hypothetical protein
MTDKSFRDYINLIENAQQGVAEGALEETTPDAVTKVEQLFRHK